jgi:hypothetical protein
MTDDMFSTVWLMFFSLWLSLFERLYSISITFGVNSQAYGVNSGGSFSRNVMMEEVNLPFYFPYP